MPSPDLILAVLIILAGFYMAWSIGANDVANAMGTSVGSGALTLKQAILIAAVLEFCGAYFFGSHVSETIQKGIVDPEVFANTPELLVLGMLAALIGTGVWLQLASYFGLPVSTTHAIVGAVAGFGLLIGGWEAIYWDNMLFIAGSWVISPLLGGLFSFSLFMLIRKHIFYKPHPLEAAKKLMPWLVAMVAFVLGLILLFNGLSNVDLELSLGESILASLVLGAIAGAVSYFPVQKVQSSFNAVAKTTSLRSKEFLVGIENARKQLQDLKVHSSANEQESVNHLIEELDSVSNTVHHPEDYESAHQDFTLIEKMFGYLQIASACLMAFSHGANDVANAIGPLAAAWTVLHTGTVQLSSTIPPWTLALGGVGIVVGLATWGWRVIEKIGKKITELTPTRGFSAEFGAAITILLASRLGLPISTTHTLVGAVIGIGFARGVGALNVDTMRDIAASWIVTIPAAAALTMATYFTLLFLFV